MKIQLVTEKIFVINDGNEKSFTTGGIISKNGTILIGCDDRLTPEIIKGLNLPEVTAIFCCDYRRSANAGILNFDKFDKTDKYINKNFYDLLTKPELWWENPENRWHLYKLRPDDDILAYGAHNVRKIADNEQIIIGDVKIAALLTPGDTDYSMSYLVEDNGTKVIFCGGLLYKGGKIPYLHRLTQGIPNEGHWDYHGYLRGIPRWKNSLDIISQVSADILVPYLGGIINTTNTSKENNEDNKDNEDIEIFSRNIDEYYDKYASISAINFFFNGGLDSREKMEQSKLKDFPDYIKSIGNQCNIIISKTGSAFAIDCGGEDVTNHLLDMIERGEIKGVDAMYITHYHDDHVDGCEYFRKHFDCPIYADKIQADILKNPIRYRLPCISPVSVDVTPLDDGHSWRWHEFELTSFAFPGQSLYHDGLMVKNTDMTDKTEIVFFAGDSFTPTGMDDYCAYNRNLLIPGEGYFRCLNILKKYMPDYIINQHIDKAFSFTIGQLEYMEKNLMERMAVLSKLSPWDNINYLHDEYFVMAYPYERYEQNKQSEQDKNDGVEFLISDYADNVKCEVVAPKQAGNKNIYGIRIYVGDIYLGQKACFIINNK